MNHHINLLIQTFSKLIMVGKFKDVLQSLYAYFFHDPKKNLKVCKIGMYCENQGLTHFQEHQNMVNFYFIPHRKKKLHLNIKPWF